MMVKDRARQGMAVRKGERTGSDISLTMKSATRPALIARRELQEVTRDIVLDSWEEGRPREWC